MIRQMMLWSALCWMLCGAITVHAQVDAPELRCIVGDTLFWENPGSNCGSFLQYEIYAANSLMDSFFLLTVINDESQQRYFDFSVGIQTRFYYMRSRYNCANGLSAPSDTLDNLPPQIINVKNVSVLSDGSVHVRWDASIEEDVIGYILYRNTPQGIRPIDTVHNGSSYLDTSIDASLRTYSYYVIALSDCGSTSIFIQPHITLLPTVRTNACARTAHIDWNAYLGWEGGPKAYEIWLSSDQSPFKKVGTLDGQTLQYVHFDLDHAVEYCFQVHAVRSTQADTAVSATVCFVSDVKQAIRKLRISELTVIDQNAVQMAWDWNENAALHKAEIWSYPSADLQAFLLDTYFPDTPLSSSPIFISENFLGEENRYFYVETQDVCDTIVQSEHVSPIFLSGSFTDDNRYALQWTSLVWPGFDFEHYSVIRVDDNGQESSVATIPSSQALSAFVDSRVQELEGCFVIEAQGFFGDSAFPQASRSNIVCIERDAIVQIPNAFAPLGLNETFKPLISIGRADLATYSLTLFDRWGRQLFVSNDPQVGWNGFYNRQLMPQGMYVYRLSLTQASGRSREYTGQVFLMH